MDSVGGYNDLLGGYTVLIAYCCKLPPKLGNLRPLSRDFCVSGIQMSIRDHLAQAEVPTSAKVNHAGSMELSENHVPGQPHVLVLNTSSLSWGSSHRPAHIIQWGQPIPEDAAQGKSQQRMVTERCFRGCTVHIPRAI